MSPALAIALEYSAVALNIVFTILIGREIRLGWSFGFVAALIGVVLYAVQNAWLMSALNGFYAVMGLYGWWNWGRDEASGKIIRFGVQQHAVLIGIGVIGTWALMLLMKWLDQPGVHLGMEAFIASFAMVATWMMSKKVLENWFYWTVGDLVAVVYNHWIGYDGYALLNAIYIALAMVGFMRWRKQMNISSVSTA
ncbi:MAG: nicotinamide mononucleotide transporter [Flavobacteriales bacterium]|nr:nicotinamide mononucleotide transporter [Flavobacteriales bacterium]